MFMYIQWITNTSDKDLNIDQTFMHIHITTVQMLVMFFSRGMLFILNLELLILWYCFAPESFVTDAGRDLLL